MGTDLRVAFVVPELGPSGGISVVRSHARQLREHEASDAVIVVASGPHPDVVDGVPVLSVAAAAARQFDVAVGTWWTTFEVLWELDANRRVAFLQSFEQRFYRRDEPVEQAIAAAVLELPVGYIVIARHAAEIVRRLRPDAPLAYVRNGIDKAVFSPGARPPSTGPLRVLVEGQPTLALKGLAESVAALKLAQAPLAVTFVANDPAGFDGWELPADATVLGGLGPEAMAGLYREHDVLLKTSRVEGAPPLPILEALHCGLPVISTPFSGHDEVLAHGVNSLIVGFDDVEGVARALDELHAGRALRAALADGAVRSVADWPDLASSSAAFGAALRGFVDAPEVDPDAAMRALLRGRRRSVEAIAESRRRFSIERDGMAKYVDAAAGTIDRLNGEIHDLFVERDALAASLRTIRESVAYRAMNRARGIADTARGGRGR